jgi:glycerophosphoryl diester phosphodiesterase
LPDKKPLEIIAHRGGGRITDFLPSSENSVELIRNASRFGATGAEIDIQMTKDRIPIIYHDPRIDDRLTTEIGIKKLIGDYTLEELKKFQLKKGEQIPTLEETLKTIVEETPLRICLAGCKRKRRTGSCHRPAKKVQPPG